jgi:hypothetical protein
MISAIEQDDLHALAGGAKYLRRVDAFLLAAGIVFGNAEEIEKNLLRLPAFGIFSAGVVEAIIMVIPCCNDRARLFQLDEAGLIAKQLVLGAHHVHVVRVGVDIVAEKDEHFRLRLHHRVPDWLRLVLLGTGTERNPRQRLLARAAAKVGCHDKQEQNKYGPKQGDRHC